MLFEEFTSIDNLIVKLNEVSNACKKVGAGIGMKFSFEDARLSFPPHSIYRDRTLCQQSIDVQ